MKPANTGKLLESIQDLIYETDPSGVVTYANQAFADMFGFDSALDVKGRNIRDFYSVPAHRDLLEREMEVRGGTLSDYMVVVKRRDGSSFYLSVDSNLVSPDETSPHVRGTGRDITMKLAMLGPFFQCNSTGMVTFCDAAFARLFSMASETEIIGSKTMEQLFCHDRLGWAAVMAKLGEKGCDSAIKRLHLIDEESRETHVLIRAGVIRGRDGTAHGFEGTLRDITQDVTLKEYFETLLDRSMDGIYLLQDFDFKMVNHGIETILGVKREHLLDHPFLDFVHEADKELVQQRVDDKLHGLECAAYEFRVVHGDGELRNVRCNSTRVLHESRPAVFGYLRDITAEACEQRRLEDAVAERTREKDEFLELAVHELDAPLVGIRGTAQISAYLLRQYEAQQIRRVRTKMVDIEQLADLGLMLVKNVSVANEDRPLSRPRAASLKSDVIVSAINFVKPLIRNRRFSSERVVYHERGPLPPMWIDVGHFRQVFFNLLSNAIKYAYVDPSAFNVLISMTIERQGFAVVVRDTGIGVPEDDIERVFEKGERGGNVLNLPGKGLGLCVIRKLLSLYGATIEIECPSLPTQFKIILPTRLAHIPGRKEG